MARVHGHIFDNFSEEALEALDFARCQRADGSFYGTSGQCRKGKETSEKPAETPKAKPRASVSKEEKADRRAAARKDNEEKAMRNARTDSKMTSERAAQVKAAFDKKRKSDKAAESKPVPPANDVKEMTDRLKKTFVGGNGETRPWTKDHQAVWDRVLSATDTKALGSLTRKLNKEVFDNDKYNVNAGFLKNSLGIMKEWLQANQRSGAGAKREAELANMTPEERRRARTADAIQRGIRGGVVNPRMR